MNKWMKISNYFGESDLFVPLTRKDYLLAMKKIHIRPITADYNRCILMTAGYLRRIKRGVYEKVKSIPFYLTYMQARKEAYGIKGGK